MTSDERITVDQALQIVKKELEHQASQIRGSCITTMDSFKRTESGKALFNVVRLYHQSDMLAGLADRIDLDWFLEIKTRQESEQKGD